jgi:beta-N-acetylhexosaminidase
MSERQRVGQLLMVDCPTSGVTDATRAAIRQYDVGSVILDGTSYAGRAEIRAVTRDVQTLAPKGVRLLVATDQEGGQVQRLQGPGFTRIPAATVQGGVSPSSLRRQTGSWAAELRKAGVDVDLAPVLDVVPAGFGANPPVGDLNREYGSTPAAVTAHGVAVARGLADAGVAATVKHFPGLGRVHGNTDLTSGVTDTVTTEDDPYLAPFRTAIAAGVPFVMISTAAYARIDPGVPAAFSSRIVTGLLRGRLGFRGVVISDDIGQAAQVADVSIGQRAVRFVAAGGDVVLTVNATQAAAMTAALLARATADPAFERLVNAAALRVLREKAALGLLG